MEIRENNNDQNINEDFNNLKNVISFILIIIISYLIETSHPNRVVRIIYILIIIFIIIGFISKNMSKKHFIKINLLFKNLFMSIKSSDSNGKLNSKNLEKIKDIYASGYYLNSNKKYNFNKNKEELKSIISNKYSDLNRLGNKNEGYLTNKITSINKIDKCSPSLMDSFRDNNKEDINDKKEILTKLPSPDSKCGSIISNPFYSRSCQNISNNSSDNQFFLLSSNKNNNKNLTNNFGNNNNPINILMNNENLQNINKSKQLDSLMHKIPKNKKVSYYNYLNLKSRNNNTQALNPCNNEFKYNLDKIPSELMNINYHNWIFKMKNFISRIIIPNLITKHDNNISNLNYCLFNLGLKIINTIPENESDDYMDILNEKIFFVNSNKINDIIDNSKILFQKLKNQYDKSQYNNFNYNINNNKENIFPSLNTYNSYLNEGKEANDKSNNESQLKVVFFGDTNKIKQILSIIENKIYSLQNNNEYKYNQHHQRKLIITKINSYDNPFLKKDSVTDINYKEIKEITLTRIQRLLYERIIINERLFPKELFEKINEIHALLVMEYAIERFRQLYHNFSLYESGSRGGEFMNEKWCSILPTDSQLIAHAIMNYIEGIYSINNHINQQVFLLSYPSSYNISIDESNSKNKNQTSIFLYQINPPEIEPKFNVTYKGNLIPCLLDNHNLFHSLCIYFYLLGVKNPMFVMNMGIHDFVNYITK